MVETTRMRKVIIADNTGREAQLEVNEHETVDDISRLYHEMSNHYSSSRMLFTDPAGGRVLSDKNNRLSELFPGHAEVHILVLHDTLNA